MFILINTLKNINFNIWQVLLAIALLLMGDWLALSGIVIFHQFSLFLYFLVFGMSALFILLGWDGTKKIFGKVKLSSWKWIVFAFVGSMILATLFSFVGKLLHQPSSGNGGANQISGDLSFWEKFSNLIATAFSLTGEEIYIAVIFVLCIVPLLKKISTKNALIIASLASVSIFGMSHFTTYDGNIYQCLVIIGLTHLPFIYAFIKTESLWTTIIAHILYDFTIFFIVSLL